MTASAEESVLHVGHIAIDIIATIDGELIPSVVTTDSVPLALQIGILDMAKEELNRERFEDADTIDEDE